MENQWLATNNPQLSRWTNANNSSTRNLPNEVLSFIFELVCAPTRAEEPTKLEELTKLDEPTKVEDLSKRPRIALASVCSHWQAVVWNSPELWQTLSIEVENRTLQKAASMLQMFADNRRAPRFISLTFILSEDIDELLPSLQALLSQESAPRIRRISLCNLTAKCTPVLALINRHCCNIETLYLSRSLLSCIFMKQKFEIPTCWSTITTLQLHLIPLDIWFDLLFGCPQLTELACDQFGKPTNDLIQPPSDQARMMSFPHLELLSLDTSYYRQSAWLNTLLQFYRFPSLKELHWTIHPSSYSLDLFHCFLSALPQSCDTIRFIVFSLGFSYDGDDRPSQCLEAAIAYVGKIKNLILSCSNLSPLTLMLRLLKVSTFLPSLTSFYYHRVPDESEEFELQMPNVDELFKSRKKAGAKSFRFDVPGWGFEFVDWEGQRTKLSQLMDDGGFEVVLYCGGKKLDL